MNTKVIVSVYGAVHVNLTFSSLLSYLNGAGSSIHFMKSILILHSNLLI
jgi:hypothetical protein